MSSILVTIKGFYDCSHIPVFTSHSSIPSPFHYSNIFQYSRHTVLETRSSILITYQNYYNIPVFHPHSSIPGTFQYSQYIFSTIQYSIHIPVFQSHSSISITFQHSHHIPIEKERKEKKKCLFKLKTFDVTLSTYIS